MLRRRVRKQTEVISRKLEREAALEQRFGPATLAYRSRNKADTR
jgi:hypothetical protein